MADICHTSNRQWSLYTILQIENGIYAPYFRWKMAAVRHISAENGGYSPHFSNLTIKWQLLAFLNPQNDVH